MAPATAHRAWWRLLHPGRIRAVVKAVGTDSVPLIDEHDALRLAPGALSAVSLEERQAHLGPDSEAEPAASGDPLSSPCRSRRHNTAARWELDHARPAAQPGRRQISHSAGWGSVAPSPRRAEGSVPERPAARAWR
jgi:hypothetical protein